MKAGKRYFLQQANAKDRDTWDAYVRDRSSGGAYLQSWTWGALKAHSGWHTLRFFLKEKTAGHILGAAQILQRTPLHLPPLFGHLAYMPRGPLLNWDQPEQVQAFFQELHTELKRRNAIALRFEPQQLISSPEAELIQRQCEEMGATRNSTYQPKRSVIIDISKDEEAIRATIKLKSTKYNIGYALRKGVTIRKAETEEEVKAWYRLLSGTGDRKAFGVHTEEYYLDFWRLTRQNKEAELFLAEHEGDLLSGMFVIAYGQEGIYMYGASSTEKRNLKASYACFWETIHWLKERGCTQYDLWGIPETDDEAESMAGVYAFKKGWGGEVVTFLDAYEKVYHPFAMRLARTFL